MNNYLIYNGNLFNESDELIKSDNRSFRYGDSIFETVRVIEGRICFFNDHFERLTNSAEFLEFHFDLSKEELLSIPVSKKLEDGLIKTILYNID